MGKPHRAGQQCGQKKTDFSHGKSPVNTSKTCRKPPMWGAWRDESKGQERSGGPRAGRAAAQLAVARGADWRQANRADAGRAVAVCRIAGGGAHSEVHSRHSGVRPGACSPSSKLCATVLHPALEQTMPVVGGLISGEASAAAVASNSQPRTRRPIQETLRSDCRLNMRQAYRSRNGEGAFRAARPGPRAHPGRQIP